MSNFLYLRDREGRYLVASENSGAFRQGVWSYRAWLLGLGGGIVVLPYPVDQTLYELVDRSLLPGSVFALASVEGMLEREGAVDATVKHITL